MGVEGLTEEAKPDLTRLQKDAADREERQAKEKADAIMARRIRLGHVEAPKTKSKAKAKESAKEPVEESE